jgi:hypothetical protein
LNQFSGLTHGDIQIRFSDMFLNSNIEIKDFTEDYLTPYYKGVHKKILNFSQNPSNSTAIFIPLQMLKNRT